MLYRGWTPVWAGGSFLAFLQLFTLFLLWNIVALRFCTCTYIYLYIPFFPLGFPKISLKHLPHEDIFCLLVAILLNVFCDCDSQTETHFLTQFYYITAWLGSDDLTTLSWCFLRQKILKSYYKKIVSPN